MSLCRNQNSFNNALYDADEDLLKKEQNRNKAWCCAGLFHFLFLIWALILAVRIQDENQRIIHLIFAIIFPQIYIICFYLSGLKTDQ